MSDNLDYDDLDRAFVEVFGSKVPTAKEAKSRRAREKRNVGGKDGRSAKWTGRTVQFNSRIKPELKKELIDASKKAGVSMASLLEDALVAHLAKLNKRKGK